MSENATIPTIEISKQSGPDSPRAGISTFIQRPEYVPEKFYNPKTGEVNLQDVLKSYGELEKSKSAPAPVEGANSTVSTSPVPGSENAGAPKPAATPAPVELPSIPGVNNEAMKAYSAEITKDGKLSDASYTALTTAGYPKAVVDAYLKGITADQTAADQTAAAVASARVADEQIDTIITSIGGKEALGDMQKWARASMTPEDLATYNATVSSGDVSKVKLAVAGLKHAYTQANGSEAALFGGRPPQQNAGDVFASNAEATEAIRDPRYAKDKGYRDAVAAKLGRSNVL